MPWLITFERGRTDRMFITDGRVIEAGQRVSSELRVGPDGTEMRPLSVSFQLGHTRS
jgi:hypothetical protein